ncbi:MAG: glycosyltransferase [Pseudoclavibacter sp.]|nr:glycosyltransferase [Pseudoclavibacter sp.]
MRIALVSLHTDPFDPPGWGDAGGMNVVVRHHARQLAEAGHEVEVLTRRADPDAPELREAGDGLRLRLVDAGPPRPLAKSEQGVLTEAFGEALLRLEPFELVHAHHWMSGVAALPAARAWDVPLLMSYHSIAAPPGSPLADGEPPEDALRVAGEARMAREAELLVTVSEAEARTAIERCGADPARVRVLPPGVDTELFRPLEPAPPCPGDDIGYAFLAARLQPLKGIDVAIDAIGLLPAGLRPRLVIAGEDSIDFAGYRAELEQRAARLHEEAERAAGGPVPPPVSFIGAQERERLALWLREARLVLAPSYSETFGLVAIEAAASGVPTVAAADAGGLAEAVVDGVSGVLVPGWDPAEWAEHIELLLRDSDRRCAMRKAARAHAERFAWPLVGRRLLDIYEEALRAERGSRVATGEPA